MPSEYLFEQTATSSASFITALAEDGSRYRIQFDNHNGGLIINKTNDINGNEAIAIFPNVANQIRVK